MFIPFKMPYRSATSLRFKEYLTISEAAVLLGVSRETLRNWDRQNKFKPIRHPLNGYRLYRREELEALLRQAAKEKRGEC